MIISDGFHEYQTKEKLTDLMLKIAGLSGYKSEIHDSFIMKKEEQTAFYKSMDDCSLAESALIHIFLNSKYKGTYRGFHDFIPEVFKELSHKQQGIFIEYYDALKSKAIEYGFLVEYEAIRKSIDTVTTRIIKAVPGLILFFVLVKASTTNFPLLIMAMVFAFEYMRSDANLSIKQQNEVIIQKINQEKIVTCMASSKQHLIDRGWIKDDDSNSIVKD